MFTIIFGFVCVCFAVFACLPHGAGLGWSSETVAFLKGAAPVVAALVGLIAVLIGIADIRDRQEAKREEMEALKAEQGDSPQS